MIVIVILTVIEDEDEEEEEEEEEEEKGEEEEEDGENRGKTTKVQKVAGRLPRRLAREERKTTQVQMRLPGRGKRIWAWEAYGKTTGSRPQRRRKKKSTRRPRRSRRPREDFRGGKPRRPNAFSRPGKTRHGGPDAFSQAGKTHLDSARLREEEQEDDRRRKAREEHEGPEGCRTPPGRLPSEEEDHTNPDAFSRLGKTHLGSGRLREEEQEKERRWKSAGRPRRSRRMREDYGPGEDFRGRRTTTEVQAFFRPRKTRKEEDHGGPDAFSRAGKTHLDSGRLREEYGKTSE